MSRATLYCGDALTVLHTLPDESVQCVVTSPPYWGLRDYGVAGQFGLERTPEQYVARMVALFDEVLGVLRTDGTLWLNMGDGYANDGKWGGSSSGKHVTALHGQTGIGRGKRLTGLKAKDLIGIPWRLALALQAAGWWLRSDIIWAKPNPMPESVTDRPTKSHEYIFLLSKSEEYYYDAAAIAEQSITSDPRQPYGSEGAWQLDGRPVEQRKGGKVRGRPNFDGRRGSLPKAVVPGQPLQHDRCGDNDFGLRNARTVWEIATQPYPEAHFATFPEELARRCILAGSRPGDTVLDPFGGSGTVAQVATGNGRPSIYIDLNPTYVQLAEQRIGPLLCELAPLRASGGCPIL
jgi:DNA modification methylase